LAARLLAACANLCYISLAFNEISRKKAGQTRNRRDAAASSRCFMYPLPFHRAIQVFADNSRFIAASMTLTADLCNKIRKKEPKETDCLRTFSRCGVVTVFSFSY